jgi:hypothetical protein
MSLSSHETLFMGLSSSSCRHTTPLSYVRTSDFSLLHHTVALCLSVCLWACLIFCLSCCLSDCLFLCLSIRLALCTPLRAIFSSLFLSSISTHPISSLPSSSHLFSPPKLIELSPRQITDPSHALLNSIHLIDLHTSRRDLHTSHTAQCITPHQWQVRTNLIQLVDI